MNRTRTKLAALGMGALLTIGALVLPMSAFAAGNSISVSPSPCPVRCARALDHGQSAARATSLARTGLSSIYRAAANVCASSRGQDAKRPCHR